jgi:hypothetical protein
MADNDWRAGVELRKLFGGALMREPLRALLFTGVKAAGSYDPEAVLPHIEERLTTEECHLADAFLKWCHENELPFGRANLEARFREFQESEMGQ